MGRFGVDNLLGPLRPSPTPSTSSHGLHHISPAAMPPPVVDMSGLTAEERAKIQSVMMKAQELDSGPNLQDFSSSQQQQQQQQQHQPPPAQQQQPQQQQRPQQQQQHQQQPQSNKLNQPQQGQQLNRGSDFNIDDRFNVNKGFNGDSNQFKIQPDGGALTYGNVNPNNNNIDNNGSIASNNINDNPNNNNLMAQNQLNPSYGPSMLNNNTNNNSNASSKDIPSGPQLIQNLDYSNELNSMDNHYPGSLASTSVNNNNSGNVNLGSNFTSRLDEDQFGNQQQFVNSGFNKQQQQSQPILPDHQTQSVNNPFQQQQQQQLQQQSSRSQFSDMNSVNNPPQLSLQSDQFSSGLNSQSHQQLTLTSQQPQKQPQPNQQQNQPDQNQFGYQQNQNKPDTGPTNMSAFLGSISSFGQDSIDSTLSQLNSISSQNQMLPTSPSINNNNNTIGPFNRQLPNQQQHQLHQQLNSLTQNILADKQQPQSMQGQQPFSDINNSTANQSQSQLPFQSDQFPLGMNSQSQFSQIPSLQSQQQLQLPSNQSNQPHPQQNQQSQPQQHQIQQHQQQQQQSHRLQPNQPPDHQNQIGFQQSQHGPGFQSTNKTAFQDASASFNQDNSGSNLPQSTNFMQNQMVQSTPSSINNSPGTFNRQLPNQGDIMNQNKMQLHSNQLSQSNQQMNQSQYQQQQQPHQQQQYFNQQQPFHQQTKTGPLEQQQQQQQQHQQQPHQLYQQQQPNSSYSSNQLDSFSRSDENQFNRDYQEGIQANRLSQQQLLHQKQQQQQQQQTMGHQPMTSNPMGMKGSPVLTYQQQQQSSLHQQSMEDSFVDSNRFMTPFQSATNSPNSSNIQGPLRTNLLQSKPSDTNSTLTGLIPRTVPLQSVREQLLLSSSSPSSSSPSMGTSSVPSTSHLVSSSASSSMVLPHHQQYQHLINPHTRNSEALSSPTQSGLMMGKHELPMAPTNTSLASNSQDSSLFGLMSMSQQLTNSNSLIHNNNNNNNPNTNYSPQQLIHAQQIKRMEIGECWSPVSELSPIQDVSPSIEAAEQRSMQLHQQSSSSSTLPSSLSTATYSNVKLNKSSDEYGNGLHRVTSGTISGMLADFNKQMEALSTVSPTDDRSALQQQTARRSSLSRLTQLTSSSHAAANAGIGVEPRNRSGSLTTTSTGLPLLQHPHLLPSSQSSTTATLTTTVPSSASTVTTTESNSNLIKSWQTNNSSPSHQRSSTSSSVPNNKLTFKSSQGASSHVSSSVSTLTTTVTSRVTTTVSSKGATAPIASSSSSPATTTNTTTTVTAPSGASILVTPSNLQLLAQSLPPAQLSIPQTVTHQVELAVSPVVEQTLQQQQMLIQQQQQLIILQKELYQQQQEQRQKQEQLQDEQEKRQAKQQQQQQETQSSQGKQSTSHQQQKPQKQPTGHQDRQVQTSSPAISTTVPTCTSISSSTVSTASSHHRHPGQHPGQTSSAPSTPNRKDRRRLPQPTIEEMQGAVQAISNQTSISNVHGPSDLKKSLSSTSKPSAVSGASQQPSLGSRPISPLIPRKNQVIGVPIIPPMSRSRVNPALTVLTMATPTLVSSTVSSSSSLLDPRHGLSTSSYGLIRGISPSSILDETQSEAGGLKNKRRLPPVPLDEEPVTAAAVSRRLIKERLMAKSTGNLSSKSVPLFRSASSLDHAPSGLISGGGLGSLIKEAPGALSGLPLSRTRPHSGPISPFSSLSDIANLINSSASGLAGLDLHRPHTPTLPGSIGLGPHTSLAGSSHLANSPMAAYLGMNLPSTSARPAPALGTMQKSPFFTSSLPSNSPISSPLGGSLGGGYIKSLKSQLKDELKNVVDERRRILDARELSRDKQDFYRRSETDLQALYDLNSYEAEALLARRALLNRRRPLGGLRRGETLDPKTMRGYASSLIGDPTMTTLNGLTGTGVTPDLFKSYEYEFLDPGTTASSLAYPGLLTTSSLAASRSPFGGPPINAPRRPVSSLGFLNSGLNPNDIPYGLRSGLTDGEIDPGLRESFIPNFMDNTGPDGARLLSSMGMNSFRRRSEGSLDETLMHYDPYSTMTSTSAIGYDDMRTNLTGPEVAGVHDRYRPRPLLSAIGPAHSWHPSPYASEDEDEKLTRDERASRVKAEIARRRAQLMETGRAVADDLGGGGKLHVGPSGHHPSYYSSRDQQYSSSAYRRQTVGTRNVMPDYSPTSYVAGPDYYGPQQGNRCIHGSPTQVRRSRLTRDGFYSRSLDTGYDDYTAGPLEPSLHQQQMHGHHPHPHLHHTHPDPQPATKRPKYPFPVKRILLIRDPKERAHGGSSSKSSGNCYGLRLIGGQEIPGSDQVGAFVEKIITGGAVDSLGEIREGDQVLEWNGLPLTGLSNEEVQRLVTASSNAEEVELVIRRDFNLFDLRYDYNSYNAHLCQVGPSEADYYTNNNAAHQNRGQMQQVVTTEAVDGGQYYQSP